MKRFQLCGVGNSLVDVIVEVSDEEFSQLGFVKGTMELVDAPAQQQLLSSLSKRTPRLVSGGSVGNSVIAFAQLGGNSAFLTSLGDDRYGLYYQEEAAMLGVELGTALKYKETTGTCVALLTPDAERTMRTCLAAAARLSPEDINEETIRESEWLFIEGYVFANPALGPAAIMQAVRYAKRHDTKIALTMSESFIPSVFEEPVMHVLREADLVFCNDKEACALSKKNSALEAFPVITGLCPNVVITRGPDGALVSYGGARFAVPSFPCEPIDLLGAGDMFAAGFLYGISHGETAARAARAACYLAMKVITRFGARIQTGLKEFWKEGLNAATMEQYLNA